MSIIVTTQPTVTLSAVARKSFSAINPRAIVADMIDNAEDKANLVPSNVRMTAVAARTMLGVKMTPQSFTQGLVFILLKVAHGARHETLTEGMPAGSALAVTAACATFKRGAGISALQLEHGVMTGFSALLALPAPPAPVKKASTAVEASKTIAPPSEPALNLMALKAGIARRSESAANDADEEGCSNPHNASAQALADSKAADISAKRAADAAMRETKVEQFERDAASSAAYLITSITARRDAEQITRELAASLGFRLVKIPVKKAA